VPSVWRDRHGAERAAGEYAERPMWRARRHAAQASRPNRDTQPRVDFPNSVSAAELIGNFDRLPSARAPAD